jgi:hypothetical protein
MYVEEEGNVEEEKEEEDVEMEDVEEEKTEDVFEDVKEQQDEGEQEEHPDLLACGPCGFVVLTATWVDNSLAQHTVAVTALLHRRRLRRWQ